MRIHDDEDRWGWGWGDGDDVDRNAWSDAWQGHGQPWSHAGHRQADKKTVENVSD